MTTFWRCCCSGVASALTLMPVSSSNSLMYFRSVSLRGLLTRLTSSVVPACFFQSTAADAERTPNMAAPPRAAVPARKARRVGLINECVMKFLLLTPGSPHPGFMVISQTASALSLALRIWATSLSTASSTSRR